MHELSLYGQVSKDDHDRVRKQLAGVTRMQPQDIEEIHLVFKARTPSGMEKAQSSGGTQGVQQQDIQRLKAMLNGGLYHIQLIGDIHGRNDIALNGSSNEADVEMKDAHPEQLKSLTDVSWTLEFKDTPDSGKQMTSIRLISRTKFEGGNLAAFMDHFGYDYVSRYYLRGSKFYDRETTLALTQLLRIPDTVSDKDVQDVSEVVNSDLQPLDGSGSYLLQASIEISDGNNQDLKDRAIRQLIQMRDNLKNSVNMTAGDRLALDTRIPNPVRRS